MASHGIIPNPVLDKLHLSYQLDKSVVMSSRRTTLWGKKTQQLLVLVVLQAMVDWNVDGKWKKVLDLRVLCQRAGQGSASEVEGPILVVQKSRKQYLNRFRCC